MTKIIKKKFCNKEVSNISYGCATLAELYNRFDDKEYIDLLNFSYKNGINYFDVAPFYGGGLAEKRLGEFIKNSDVRENIFIATKIGRYTDDNSNSGSGGYFDFNKSKIEDSIKKSMRNLNTNFIDLIQCHDIENVYSNKILDILPLLEHFKVTGKIGGIGINSYPLYPLENIIESTNIKIDSVGTYAHYTLINDSLKDYMEYFLKNKIKVINCSPLAMGLLTTTPPPNWHPSSKKMRNYVDKLNIYCEKKNLNISDLAMRFSCNNPDILTTITGGKNVKEISNNINSLGNFLSSETLDDIENIVKPIKNHLWGPEEGITPVYKWDYI